MVAERMRKRLNVKRRFCSSFVGLSRQKRDIIGTEIRVIQENKSIM
jgi:hypothetical protein